MGRKRQPRLTFLDTHVVCWLYQGRLDLISQPGLAAIETGLLRISPMALLELQYLYEIGRITKNGKPGTNRTGSGYRLARGRCNVR